MTATNSIRPIACDLTVFSKDERAAHADLSRRLFAACTGMRELPEGLELFFAGTVLESDVQTWCANESRCCAFAEYKTDRDAAGLRLVVRTGAEGKLYLQSQYRQILGRASEKTGSSHFKAIGALLAAALCLACLVPIVGAFLVARGIVSSFWNPGELAWIGLGLVLATAWLAFSKWKKRGNVALGCGC